MLPRFMLCRRGLGRTAKLPKFEMLPLPQRCGLEALGTAVIAFTISRVGLADLNGFEQALAIGLCLAMLIHVASQVPVILLHLVSLLRSMLLPGTTRLALVSPRVKCVMLSHLPTIL